jgi:hypothetical protein
MALDSLRIGHEYVDNAQDREIDQFLPFFKNPSRSEVEEPVRGISNAGGIRPLLTRDGELAALILITHEVRGPSHNPWEDFVDLRSGTIRYWGDAKYHEIRRLDDFPGNKRLVEIMGHVAHRRWSSIPPIMHFSKPQAGIVRFNGVCSLRNLDLGWYEDRGYPVQNYIAQLDILAISEVSRDWVSALVNREQATDEPSAWRRYSRKGSVDRMDIYASRILSRIKQLPAEGSPDEEILSQLREFEPDEFEQYMVGVLQDAAEAAAATHTIRKTRKSRDGGFDFEGSMTLLPPLNYKVRLKGEVKRYSPTTSVGPKDVARLVARLHRGEFGVFVTTSYFTDACQKEILHDGYPVELVYGRRLIEMLRASGRVESGRLRGGAK